MSGLNNLSRLRQDLKKVTTNDFGAGDVAPEHNPLTFDQLPDDIIELVAKHGGLPPGVRNTQMYYTEELRVRQECKRIFDRILNLLSTFRENVNSRVQFLRQLQRNQQDKNRLVDLYNQLVQHNCLEYLRRRTQYYGDVLDTFRRSNDPSAIQFLWLLFYRYFMVPR